MTITDLTDLRRLESFRSDFIANVSHEIRTPLTCIIGAAEALENEHDLPDTQRQKLLNMLKTQSRRLSALGQDILSLATLEKQKLVPARDFASVAIDSVVINATHLCAAKAAEAGMTLKIAENQPDTLIGDSVLLEQALTNLIENAIRYSNAKHIEISSFWHNSALILEVKDDGIGIPLEYHARIFERFFRVDKSRSSELGGTGLGLAIVKHIAQLHDGDVMLKGAPVKVVHSAYVSPKMSPRHNPTILSILHHLAML